MSSVEVALSVILGCLAWLAFDLVFVGILYHARRRAERREANVRRVDGEN